MTPLIDRPLGELALVIPGATQVFHENRLDFCCGGRRSLREAAVARGVDPSAIVTALEQLARGERQDRDWRGAGNTALIDHILTTFHQVHRDQLPELIRLARRVERVHGGREDCPQGLADALEVLTQELESHMQKEEQVLFPLLARNHPGVAGPIAMMRSEHTQHGDGLEGIAALVNDFVPPGDACTTWRALYLGLSRFREDLMQHIHLENNLLFEGLAEYPATAQVVDPASLGERELVIPVSGTCRCGGGGSGGGCA